MKNLTYLLFEFIKMLINVSIIYIDKFSKEEKLKHYIKYTTLFTPIINMIFVVASNYITKQ